MAKRNKSLPPLTPRAREVVNYLVNTVALSTHDNDAEFGAMAKNLGITPGRMLPILRKLAEQGYLTLRNDFAYPTPAALRWQNPALSENEAKRLIQRLK
jgi:DNA-binding IclR family transcriptional regulator